MPLSVLSAWLDRATNWLFQLGFGKFLSLLMFFAIVRNGLLFVPNIELVRIISLNPSHCPDMLRQSQGSYYLLTSFLGPILAWALGANRNYFHLALMHLGFFVLLFLLILYQTRRALGDTFARCVTIAFAVLPISTTVFTWLGNSDTFTCLLGSALLVFRSPIILLIIGLLQGLNHFEQGVFIILFAILAQWIVRSEWKEIRATRQLWAVAGLLLGRGGLYAWLIWHDFPISYDRLDWVRDLGLPAFYNVLANTPAIIFSLFNVFWGFVLLLGVVASQKRLAAFLGFLVLFMASLIPASLTLDVTRVFALISWPIVMVFLLWSLSFNQDSTALVCKALTAVLAAGVLIPPLMIWHGRLYSGVLFYTLRWAFELVANGFHVPPGPPRYSRPFPFGLGLIFPATTAAKRPKLNQLIHMPKR
jgi:hypothetical protein